MLLDARVNMLGMADAGGELRAAHREEHDGGHPRASSCTAGKLD